MRRNQRVAINQAEIAKRCKLYGPLLEGARAFRRGKARDENPHDLGGVRDAWDQGWLMAEEKANE